MSVGWHVCFVTNYFASHLILKKNRYGYNNGYCLRVSEKTCHVTEVGKDLAANGLVPLCTLLLMPFKAALYVHVMNIFLCKVNVRLCLQAILLDMYTRKQPKHSEKVLSRYC